MVSLGLLGHNNGHTPSNSVGKYSDLKTLHASCLYTESDEIGQRTYSYMTTLAVAAPLLPGRVAYKMSVYLAQLSRWTQLADLET
jgi:hypothetical protein